MNREIKFKGKRLDNGKWVYGSLIIEKSECLADVYKIHVSTPFEVEKCHVYEVNQSTVGQFTGLYAKGRVEIYTGDILKYGNHVGTVVWIDGSFRLDVGLVNPMLCNLMTEMATIVGNIY